MNSVSWLKRIVATALLLGGAAFAEVRGAESLRDVIDREVEAVWTREKIKPSPPADDAEFLRRVYLDLTGSVPDYDTTVAFLADKDSAKRAKLIDRLLDDPRYAQHQADVWDLILFGRNPPGYDTDKRQHFQAWLQKQFADNVPYDEWAGKILRAEGNTVDDGPPMFYVQYDRKPEDATEAITQIFLGVQLQCARCHDHPYEPWKQVDFYGMAAFVSRLSVVTVGKNGQTTKYAIGERPAGDIMFTGPAKDQMPGQKGEPIGPKFLLGDKLQEPASTKAMAEVKFAPNKVPPAPPFSRKDQLASWITGETNPYFAKAAANRVWAQFLGRGIVHPVDNMSPSNEPSHPELLATLARELAAQKYDVKWYVRELVNSRTYQRSSRGGAGAELPQWFETARTRPLSAEELAEAWRIATGYAATEKSSSGKKAETSRFRPFESSYMLRYFGKPFNGSGDFQGGMHEHLYLNNGPMSTVIATGKGSLVEALLKEDAKAGTERLYLSLLNRAPQDAERAKVAAYVSGGKADERWREAIWAVITSSEFRFNH